MSSNVGRNSNQQTSPLRRSERLRGKTVDYTSYFRMSIKQYSNYYATVYSWRSKKPQDRRRTPNIKPKQRDGNIKSKRTSAGADKMTPMNPVDRVKLTLTKLTTKCKTKGLMSSVLGKKFTCSTPLYEKIKYNSTGSSQNNTNDDYFAHISPISPNLESRGHVSVRDVIGISQQFAGVERKTRQKLTSIAEEVTGRMLDENELDELQTTIQGLDLSSFYDGNECVTLPTNIASRYRQNFVPKPIDLESITSTPRSSVFRFENNRNSPQSVRYARHVEREYSYIRRKCYNPDKPLTTNKSTSFQKNAKTLKMLDSTYTNVKKIMRTRRSSDSYEEESD